MTRKLMSALIFAFFVPAAAVSAAVSVDSMKAAYIYHFLNFTDWHDDMRNYYVCVPDDHSLKNAVEHSLGGKIVNHRPILVLDRAGTCHVLVSDRPAAGGSALTIGRIKDGAMFEFRVVNHRLRFAVNPDRLRSSPFKISSQLLKLAILDGPAP